MKALVEGTEVYLDDDQRPAFTSSVESIEDPSKITGVSSTTIRIISTKESKAIFGTPNMVQTSSKQKREFVIGSPGMDYFKGQVVPIRNDRNVIQCLAVSGNATWFDYVKDIKLRAFDFGQSEPIDDDYVKQTWTDDDDILHWVLGDFGWLEDRTASTIVHRWRLRPAVRIHQVIDRCLEGSGFTFIPRGRLTKTWKKFCVLQPTNVLTEHFYGHPEGASARPVSALSYTLTDIGSAAAPYDLQSVELDPDSRLTSTTYTAPGTSMDVRVDSVGIAVDPFAEPASGEVFYLNLVNTTTGVVVGTKTAQYVTGEYQIRWWHTFENVTTILGNAYALSIHRTAGGYSGTVNINAICLITFEPNDPYHARTFIKYDNDDIVFWSLDNVFTPIQLKTAMPDMTLAKLISGLAMDQRIMFDTKEDGTVYLWHEDEFYRTPNPAIPHRDWTDRINHAIAPAKVFDKNPRNLLFRWDKDEKDKTVFDLDQSTVYPHYANLDVTIPEAYGDEKTFTLPFARTGMGLEIDDLLTLPIFRKIEAPYQIDDFDITPRLLIAGGIKAGAWKLDTSTQTDYPYTYFVSDQANGIPLAWGNATAAHLLSVARNWAWYIGRISNGVTLEAATHIKDIEVRNFDHGMPTLLDDGSGKGWYFVHTFKDHQMETGEPTKTIYIPWPDQRLVDSDADPLFLCEGPGYGSIVIENAISDYVETSTNRVAARNSATGVIHLNSSSPGLTVFSPPTAGSYCVYSSDINGEQSGDMITFGDYDEEWFGLTEIHMTGWAATLTKLWITAYSLTAITGLELCTSLVTVGLSAWPFATLDVTTLVNATHLNVTDSIAMDTLLIPPDGVLDTIDAGDTGIQNTNDVLAAIVASGVTGGTIVITGLSCAAPTGQGIIDKAFLIGTRGWTVNTN